MVQLYYTHNPQVIPLKSLQNQVKILELVQRVHGFKRV
jgi:hypothetical protein